MLRADTVAVEAAAANQAGGAPTLSSLVRGAPSVAKAFAGRARGAQLAQIEGMPGAVWAPGGRARAVFDFSIIEARIVAIEVLADPEHIAQLAITIPDS